MTKKKSHFIYGKWLEGDGSSMSSINPATDAIVWEGFAANESEVNSAVEVAKKAYKSWKETSLEHRIAILRSFGNILTQKKEKLALALSDENGKPLWESLTEISAMIGKIELSIEAYKVRCPEMVQQLPHSISITRHHPHGPLAVLGPFNFPAHLPNGHIVPALLAGNTVVFKPSELTPHIAQLITECWEETKIPPGVINLIQGNASTGKLLSNHPDIKGILFTGSWATGSLLSEVFAKTPNKILALEMGGNNPLVIGDVKNIPAAAFMAAQTAFLTSGQRCTCARRLIMPKGDTGDKILDHIKKIVAHMVIGPHTLRPEPFMGPLISKKAAENVFQAYNRLIKSGGQPIVKMKFLGNAMLSPGVVDMTNVSDVADEEIFGPVLQVFRTKSFDDAITEANRTEYGLSSGLLSDRREQFDQFYKEIHSGLVNWNQPLTGASSAAPFGGLGKSGNFRPSAFYAADYCVYPVVSLEVPELILPKVYPGISAFEGDHG